MALFYGFLRMHSSVQNIQFGKHYFCPSNRNFDCVLRLSALSSFQTKHHLVAHLRVLAAFKGIFSLTERLFEFFITLSSCYNGKGILFSSPGKLIHMLNPIIRNLPSIMCKCIGQLRCSVRKHTGDF